MRRAVIYGIGEYYLNNKNKLPDDIEIIAYADSSEKDNIVFRRSF